MIDENKFNVINEYFNSFDNKLKQEKGSLFWDTNKGIYGAASCEVVFEFFKKIGLQNKECFLDLGSGDGRVVMIASLFTKAVGIESDPELVELSEKIKSKLNADCEFQNTDFTEIDLSEYDVIFINPDQSFPEEFEMKILNELKGRIYIYNEIFQPTRLKKGKKHWQGQIPVVEYSA